MRKMTKAFLIVEWIILFFVISFCRPLTHVPDRFDQLKKHFQPRRGYKSTTKLFELITAIIIKGVKTGCLCTCREAWELTGRLSVVRNRRLRVSACGRRKAGQQITVSRVWYRLKHVFLPLCCHRHRLSFRNFLRTLLLRNRKYYILHTCVS